MQVLFMAEFYLLIELVEVIVPTVYSIYLGVLFYSPNRHHFAHLKTLTDDQYIDTLQYVAKYAVLELLSLLALAVVFRRQLRISPLHHLAFTLQTNSAGGVAILLCPQGILQRPRPLWQHLWSPWFMAVEATMLDKPVTLINVYAPSGKPKAREDLFAQLQACPAPPGTIIFGGDFNCTLDSELDRSRFTKQTHDSPELHALLRHWSLVDAIAPEMEAVVTDADKLEFHTRQHTYFYPLRDGSVASSRLDRWYVSSSVASHVESVCVATPVNDSDHNSVTLVFVVNPDERPRRRRSPRLRYPLPFGCRDSISDLTAAAVTEFAACYTSQDGAVSAGAWDELKTRIRTDSLKRIRLNLRTQRRGIRQRRRRLNRALRTALLAVPQTQMDPHPPASGLFAKVVSLRRSLIRLERRRARIRRRRTFALYSGSAPAAERAFFHRFRARQGYSSPIALPADGSEDRSVADRLAADWSTITQRGATEPGVRNDFFASLPVLAGLPCLSSLDREFSEAEVRAATLACPRGKAPGPDGLPNDWYLDHVDLLTPVLTTLLNQWHLQRTLPPSFRHAAVACVPKVASPQTGLDFRPIALLDTDYKIYARLLLNRLSLFLPELVAPTQYGFVPGRQVHDALDIFHGLQKMVAAGDVVDSAVAVLLDFAKAYDTLDRPFLLSALDRLGFPTRFLRAVEQMHLHTTAEFVADDSTSAVQPILNGIRQGCPLAPTLFLLAVNTLYEAIAHDPAVRGVRLPGGEELCATGYADDTTCYLEALDAAVPLRAVLDRFGEASGLKINVNKCVAVRLCPGGELRDDTVSAFPLAAAAAASRLLGGQVAAVDVSEAVWSITMQQLRTRLYWAALKTTNELQRVKLLRAVLLPKFLFVARHHWPTARTVEKFQRLVDDYVWGGGLAADGNRKRGWMSQQVARAPSADGGLHIPHLSHELQVLSLSTIERWAQPCVGAPLVIRRALLGVARQADGLLAPTRTPAVAQLRLLSTLTATGLQLRRTLAVHPRASQELDLLHPLLVHVGRGTSADYKWHRGWLQIDYGRVKTELSALRDYQFQTYGNLDVHALLQARVCGEDILWTSADSAVSVVNFPGVFRAADRIGEIVEVRWDQPGQLQFRARRHDAPLSPHLATHFRHFCDTLVFNYPGILRPPAQPEDLVLRPPTLDVWRLVSTPHGHRLQWSPVEQAPVDLGVVSSTAHASTVARQLTNSATASFDRHGWLDAPFAIWTGLASPNKRSALSLLRAPSVSRCEREQQARADSWRAADPVIASALDELDWDEILQLEGAPSAHRLLFHKLKGARLSGWDRLHDRRGCPHCPALGSAGGTVHHVFWACPQAQDRWRQLLVFWDPLYLAGRHLHGMGTASAIFSLRLQPLPDGLWSLEELTRLGEPTAHDTVATQLALTAVWQRHVLVTLYTIWRWRTVPDTIHDVWTSAQARAYQGHGLAAVSHDVRWRQQTHSAATKFTAAALDVLFGSTAVDRPLQPAAPAPTDKFLLFFDGGSRGNPGPGGSGAVIVRVDNHATGACVIWSAAMAHGASTTTNNQAEYRGLLTGLTAALQHKWKPLEVIGDSQLVLRQMELYRPPLNETLLHLYAPARRLADQLHVRRWTHHRRAYNTMADAVANAAMDSRSSSQVFHPTERTEHARLADMLANDLAHWQVTDRARY